MTNYFPVLCFGEVILILTSDYNRVGKVPSQTETHTTHYTTCRDMLKRHIDTITVYRIFKNIVWVCVIFFRIVIAFHHDVFV